MVITPKGVMLSAQEFEALPDYSCTLPTGTIVGKRWRRRQPYIVTQTSEHTYFMGEYVESYKPGQIGIQWTEILLPPDYIPRELRQRPGTANARPPEGSANAGGNGE